MNVYNLGASALVGVILLAFTSPHVAGAGATDACKPDGGVVAEGTRDGVIVFRVNYRGTSEIRIRVCIEDESHVKIHDHEERVPAATAWEHSVAVPTGRYRAATIATASNNGTVAGGHSADLILCAAGSVVLPSNIDDGPGITVLTPVCGGLPTGRVVEPNQQRAPSEDNANPAFFGEGTSQDLIRWELLAASLGLVGLVAFPRPRYALLALFSRVQGPAVLDQETRSEIYEFIRNDPGVNAHRIARQLGLGSGETRYHVTVLRRNRLVTEIRRGALRCYFPFGVASPEQLRATAVLHHAGAERLYEAILGRPDASLTVLAADAGLRLSTASKALSKLVEGGLAQRIHEGRELRVRPTTVRPLLPLFEANPSSEVPAVS